MAPLRTLLWCIATLAIAVLAGATARAANVGISRMETTFHRGSDRFLRAAIDGFDYGREGWSVKPQVDKPQSAILVFKEPALCARLKTSLAFLSGQSGAYFQEFALSVTSDANPTFQSEWVTLQPWLSYSTGTKLEMLPLGHLRSVGKAYMTAFVVESLVKPEPITALRIEVFPARSDGDSAEGFVGGNSDHDFLLTEVRVQSFEMDSSNVALGAPARASHALWGNFRAEFLTDGLPSTFSHPRDPSLGEQFFFEIDFGKVRPLDHLSLRGRSDGIVPERLSNLQIELYEEPPDADTPPVWTATYRGDGSYPPIGSVEVLRAASGHGDFRARYIRLSSRSPISYSPQLAEVEAYEPLVPRTLEARADKARLPPDGPFHFEAGTRWFSIALSGPEKVLPQNLPLRWRIAGFHPSWQPARRDGVAEGPCPPPGDYFFEAQIAHSDGEWNEGVLRIPLRVDRFWWESPVSQTLGGLFLLGTAAISIRYFARRRLQARLVELESRRALDEERARIARDMHDVVGARLTQLGVLHEIFSRKHALPPDATESLARLSSTAREAIAALDEVVWAVNPRNDTLANLADYLCFCAGDYLQPLGIPCRLDVPADWPEIQVRAQTRHEVLLAFKEALQNIAKHAQATEVRLTLRNLNQSLLIQLDDNGMGIPREQSGMGKDGLLNMRQRIQSVGGSCSVEPLSKEGGTRVQMIVSW